MILTSVSELIRRKNRFKRNNDDVKMHQKSLLLQKTQSLLETSQEILYNLRSLGNVQKVLVVLWLSLYGTESTGQVKNSWKGLFPFQFRQMLSS